MHFPNQQIKLIAIDIDGTLLNSQRQITQRTKEAIHAARAAGISVTLATARRYSNSRQFAEELDMKIPLITYDGALTIVHPQKKIIDSNPLNADTAQQVVDALVRHSLQPIVHHIIGLDEATWSGPTEFDNPELAAYFAVAPDPRRLPHEILCQGQRDPLRVVSFAAEEAISSVNAEIEKLDCFCYTIRRGLYNCAELTAMRKHCSKATALFTLAEHLQIPLEQVMAIGDNTNDKEMLQVAGWGVAMGHAPLPVRSLADAVTGSNAEDGVAQAIERYAL